MSAGRTPSLLINKLNISSGRKSIRSAWIQGTRKSSTNKEKYWSRSQKDLIWKTWFGLLVTFWVSDFLHAKKEKNTYLLHWAGREKKIYEFSAKKKKYDWTNVEMLHPKWLFGPFSKNFQWITSFSSSIYIFFHSRETRLHIRNVSTLVLETFADCYSN